MEDKFIYETNDRYEMELVTKIPKIMNSLYELREWYNAVSRGKDEFAKMLVQGKIINFKEYMSPHFHNRKDLKRDKNGMLLDCQTIYFREDITDKIEEILEEIWDVFDY